MGQQYGWQRILTHGGRFVAELHLQGSDTETGKIRSIQSGARPNWRHALTARVLEGPVTLADDRRSIRPGETGMIEIHPLLPQDWAGISQGSELELLSPRETVIGIAYIVRVLEMPPSATADFSCLSESPNSPSEGWLTH